jgi:hypothetical protein
MRVLRAAIEKSGNTMKIVDGKVRTVAIPATCQLRQDTHLRPGCFMLAALLLASASLVFGASATGEAIVIDTGRQLFVDDLLIAETRLKRTFHAAEVYGDRPLLKPETPLELNLSRGKDALPVAAPFCDGVWFDPDDGLFKMWYHAGWFDAVGYATSKDGIHWQRPALDVTPGTNRVLPPREENGCQMKRDAASIWRDAAAKDANERWKMFVFSRLAGRTEGESHGELFSSPDGVHWKTLRPVGFWHGDNTSLFHDPFRNQWVLSVRERAPSLRYPKKTVRARFIHTATDFVKLAERKDKTRAPLWLKLDGRDLPDPELGCEPELYHFTATPYESIMLGVFGIFYGPPNEVCSKEKRPKIMDLQLGYSRDGFIYDRPHREAFLKCARTPGAWNRGYLHPATGVCLIVGDQLRFYFGTWSGVGAGREHMYAGGSTGLATLRRDGFASMDADEKGGTLTTRTVTFKGAHLFVNAAASKGELRVEALDEQGNVIAPFTTANCVAFTGDKTRHRVTWKDADDLSQLTGKPVRLRFHLKQGALYSFWVSPNANGASHGYVAAGGPGFTGATDTTGK